MFIDYFFLHLEARRFQSYETSRYRVQLLERTFYPSALGARIDYPWVDQTIDVLGGPGMRVSYLGAVGWRLRRTYLWIFLAIFLAWASKLDVAGWSNLDFISRAAVGSVPGWLVWLVVVGLYGWLIGLAAFARRTYCFGSEEGCD